MMITSHTLKKRDIYLNRLIAFQDTEMVKVVTGIRRCGTSTGHGGIIGANHRDEF